MGRTFEILMVVAWLAISVIFAGGAQGASQNDFTLNVIHDNYPVREMDRRVALRFDSEYQLRLKNGHDRKATAKVWIDGALVSQLGDFILAPDSTFDLERFLSSSLTEGKRFRFVSLDHPDVDDPSRDENGIVKVEFKLEKVKIELGIAPYVPYTYHRNPPIELWSNSEDWITLENKVPMSFNTYSDSSVLTSGAIEDHSVLTSASNTLPGATVGGTESTQAFQYAHVDVEDEMTVLMLRIVGIAPRLSYLWPW